MGVTTCQEVQTDIRLLLLHQAAADLLTAAEHLAHADHECDISLRLVADQADWLARRLARNEHDNTGEPT